MKTVISLAVLASVAVVAAWHLSTPDEVRPLDLHPSPTTPIGPPTEPARPSASEVSPVAAIETREFAPDPLGAEGTVRDHAGAPMAGVEVVVWPTGDRAAGSRTVSDVQGRYQIRGLRPGPCTVAALSSTLGLSVPVHRTIGCEGLTRIDLTLNPVVSFLIKVIDERGKGLAGARVTATRRSTVRVGICDDSGLAEITGIADTSGHYRIHCEYPGLGMESRYVTLPAGKSRAPFLVHMRRPSRLAGTVVDAKGQPVANAIVDWAVDRTRTDPSGRFSLTDVIHHPCSLVAFTESRDAADVVLVGSEDAGREDLVISLRPTRSIVARVQSTDGTPLDGYATLDSFLQRRFLHYTNVAFPRGLDGLPGAQFENGNLRLVGVHPDARPILLIRSRGHKSLVVTDVIAEAERSGGPPTLVLHPASDAGASGR